MATPWLPQNPGIGGLAELTDAEQAFLTSFAGLSYSDGDILYADSGFITNLSIGSEGQVLTVVSGFPAWQNPTSGSTTFLALTDTPSAYTGQGGKAVAVNVGETALEFVTFPAGYTDEQAQDAVGGILTDSSEIDFTYNDATPSITASIVAGSIDESKLDASVNASLDLADSASQPGHTHTASNITDFDTEVSNNADVAANTSARHNAVTVLDSAEIDFTLTGQQITASIIAGSIDESHLDVSVNASLDLADSSAQPGDNISIFTNDSGFISDITGENLADLADVVITTVADNEVLAYDNGSGNWINQTAAEAGLAAATHTHTASDITDFDTEVSNNTDVAANTSARHDAVTVSDSAEIDFTLTGQQISASIVAGSIDESKLDTSVNASLDLADSSIQPGDDITDLSTTFTAGSVVFSNGSDLAQDNANFFWDNTNKALLIGSNSPSVTPADATIFQTTANNDVYHYMENGVVRWRLQGGDAEFTIGDGTGFPFVIDAGLGIGSFRLTSTGLGLGTSIPTAKLDVRGSLSQQGGNITFNASSVDNDFNINGSGLNNIFFTDASTNRVSIGANEINPATILHIKQNDTVTVPTVEIEQHSTGDAGIQLSIVGDSYAIGIDNSDSDHFKISYASTAGTAVLGTNDRLIMDSSGNVSLGGTAPATNFHVFENNTDTTPTVEIEQLSTGDAGLIFSIVGDSYVVGIDNSDSDLFKFSYAAAAGTAVLGTGDIMTIDGPNARVGIGTTTPATTLHVDAGSGNVPLRIESTGTTAQQQFSGTGTIVFSMATTQGGARTFWYSNNGSSALFKNTTDNAGTFAVRNSSNSDIFNVDFGGADDAMVINSSSDVGIGVGASPTTRLHVKDDDNTTVVTVEINATSANVTASDTFIDFRSSSGSIGSIAGTASSGVIAYNTFTGSHWSQSDTIYAVRREEQVVETKTIQKEDDHGVPYDEEVTEERTKVWYESDLQPGAVLISIDEMSEWEGEEESDYLPKVEVSSQKEDKRVYGVYGGHDKDGDIMVLALGAGRILVCDEAGEIEVGDFLCSSSTPGHAMKYSGNDMRVVVAKARMSFSKGEGLIACTYLCG